MSAAPRLPGRARLGAVVLAWSLAAGCADPAGVRVSDVAGTYVATSLVAEGDDVLAAGGSLTLTFQPNGLMSGTLFVPASVGGPLTADMNGTWTLVDRTLVLAQTEDTFVRDAIWIWTHGVIDGTCCTGGTTVTVKMERP
ncbi:MAG: hypothetical protein AB7T31_00025 [Gemmatimonadales bacterium]